MPLEIKCRYALQHYYSHGDHSPIIRKYVRRAKIIRPDNWRDALPESVRDIEMFTVYRGGIGSIERAPLSISWSLSYDVAEWFAHRSELFYRCPCHVYQGTIHADKVIAYLPERSEFEIIQHRNVKDVQEITPLRGYSPPFNAFKSSKKWVHNEEESNRYFNEWYQSQNSWFLRGLDDKSYYHCFTAIKFAKPSWRAPQFMIPFIANPTNFVEKYRAARIYSPWRFLPPRNTPD